MPLLPQALMGGMAEGMPPDMMPDMMGGQGMPPDMMGGPPPPDMGGPPQGGEKSDAELLREMIDLGKQALDNASDDVDSAEIAKILQALIAILAGRQKEQQQVLGNPATQRVVGRAYGG